jgi:hypothetical protein
MRAIELISLCKKHNEILLKWVKGELWFQNPNISDEKKKSQEKRYLEIMKELDESYDLLSSLGITFDYQEATTCIELPEELKRKDVEGFLEHKKSLDSKGG